MGSATSLSWGSARTDRAIHTRARRGFGLIFFTPLILRVHSRHFMSALQFFRTLSCWAGEKAVKGFLFDCQMCGQCALSSTGMSCSMNCPKTIRNGPCGGVRANGNCEVKPEMRCVWVEAFDGSQRMQAGREAIKVVQFAVDGRLKGSSSWLRVAREKGEPVQQEAKA